MVQKDKASLFLPLLPPRHSSHTPGGHPVPTPIGSQHLIVPSCEPPPKAGNVPRTAYTSMSTAPRRLRQLAHTEPHTGPLLPVCVKLRVAHWRAAVHAGIAALYAGNLEDPAGPPCSWLPSLSCFCAFRLSRTSAC